MNHIDRKIPPQQYSISPFELKEPLINTLQNGLKFYYFINSQLDLIHLSIRIHSGALFEPQKGVSSACYSLLKESSSKKNANEIDSFLDFWGVNYQTTVSFEFVTISILIPKNNYLKVLPEIFDFIAHPQFNNSNLELYKEKKRKNWEQNRQKNNYCANELMFHAFYGEESVMGTIQDSSHIAALTTQQLSEFHQNSFVADNIRCFVAGNIDKDIEEMNNTLFSTLTNRISSLVYTSYPVAQPLDYQYQEHEHSVQSSIILFKPFIHFLHPDRRELGLLTTLLGGYFGSRLMQNLREKYGFTYGINCSTIFFQNHSLFYIESEVNQVNTLQAIEHCRLEIEKIQQNSITTKELNLVKNWLLGCSIREVENTTSYMKKYICWDDFHLNKDEFNKNMEAIHNCDIETLEQLSQQHFKTDSFSTVIAGNINHQQRLQ